MKKLLVLVLAIVFALSLTACEKQKEDADQLVSRIVSNIQSEIKDELDISSVIQNNSTLESKPAKNEALISKTEAKQIALKHAGLKEAQVFDLDIELDRERGAISYEIDFETREFEFEYDIDAKSGEIIKNFKEINN